MYSQWLNIDDIHVGARHRAPDVAKVKVLAASIKDHGLLHPPAVRFVDGVVIDGVVSDAVPQLITGRHRLLALKENGERRVECRVYDVDDADAELMEIDENLARAELSPAEEAAHVARRKELWEDKHGKAKANSARAANEVMGRTKGRDVNENFSFTSDSADKIDDERTPAFTKATSSATGKTMRSVQMAAQRAKELGNDNLEKIAGTSLDKGVEMDALIKLPEPERKELIARAAAGEKVSARPAKPEPSPNEPRIAIINKWADLYNSYTDEEKEIALIKINARRED